MTGEEGACSVPYMPRSNTSLDASFAGDDAYSPSISDTITVLVHMSITGEMRRFSGRDGRYRTYGPQENVVYVARVRPPHPRRQVTIKLEYNFGSGWQNGGHGDFRQNDKGLVGVYFEGGSLPPGKFRLQTTQERDHDHLGGQSAWTLFKITRAARTTRSVDAITMRLAPGIGSR
jgi:hypothetical protein